MVFLFLSHAVMEVWNSPAWQVLAGTQQLQNILKQNSLQAHCLPFTHTHTQTFLGIMLILVSQNAPCAFPYSRKAQSTCQLNAWLQCCLPYILGIYFDLAYLFCNLSTGLRWGSQFATYINMTHLSLHKCRCWLTSFLVNKLLELISNMPVEHCHFKCIVYRMPQGKHPLIPSTILLKACIIFSQGKHCQGNAAPLYLFQDLSVLLCKFICHK